MKQSSETDLGTIDEVRASERLQTLYAVNNMLKQVEADGLNIRTVLPRILRVAVEQLDAHDGSIIVINRDLEIEHAWLANIPSNQDSSSLFLDDIMDRGLAGRVIRNQRPSVINDTRSDERWLPRPGHVTSTEPWSVICTPFLIRNRAVGAITIHKLGKNQFDERDLNLLTAISNQAASTIENARLFEDSQRQLRISALLNEASRVINSSLDINEIMRSLLAQMNEFLNAEAISIALVDKQTNELVYQVAEGVGSDKIVNLRLPSNQGLSGWVMEHGEPALVPDTSRDPRFHNLGDRRTGHPTRAMICAPMQFKGKVLGTIQAINPIEGTFTKQDLNLLVNLANIASSAIANAQQFARTQAAEARYMSLFQDSVDPIILTDMSGKIMEANRRAIEFLGYSRDELLKMSIKDLHPKTVELPEADRFRADEVKVFTSQAILKEDPPIHVEVYAKRTLFGDNQLLQWIHHDISKQIELEEMRQDLTAMLFHDLQSPLGNVISSLQLLSDEIPTKSDPAVTAMLDIALRSSNRLQALIRSLLDISRLEAGHPVSEQDSVDVYRLVDEVAEMERPNFEKRRVKLVQELTPNLPHVYAEEDMVRRVLVNLLDNALKHSRANQQITISAKVVSQEQEVLITVSDQGNGIPEKYRKSIFEKFQRIKINNDVASQGLGLGLAFCRLAVEAHDGRIWVDDAPDGGARFSFTLPAVAQAVPT